jgi:hypothetical protein
MTARPAVQRNDIVVRVAHGNTNTNEITNLHISAELQKLVMGEHVSLRASSNERIEATGHTLTDCWLLRRRHSALRATLRGRLGASLLGTFRAVAVVARQRGSRQGKEQACCHGDHRASDATGHGHTG